MPETYVSLSRYDFLVVFIGILVGLSVAKLVSFLGQLASGEKPNKLSATHWTYLALLFLMQVHYWWALWFAKAIGEANLLVFFQLLAPPLLMYLATAILSPEGMVAEAKPLQQYFEQRAKAFYTVLIALFVISTEQGIFIWHQPPQAIVLKVIFIVLTVIALLVSSTRFRLIVALVQFLVSLIYVIGSHFYLTSH